MFSRSMNPLSSLLTACGYDMMKQQPWEDGGTSDEPEPVSICVYVCIRSCKCRRLCFHLDVASKPDHVKLPSSPPKGSFVCVLVHSSNLVLNLNVQLVLLKKKIYSESLSCGYHRKELTITIR
uniref:Uncharacterized protein n=1 Tax=Hordeum vulgare subsp. vulgare TaxID=112509 RepID=A0A8I6XDD4_HORVV